ncbi:DUF3889 domain-containing protein [Cohnella rhizosphaerae]|uniref:YqzG/YhdC family protein n=1 Tax=Cohnella rhizosphaerae TaxID=1457232 RepID=A0A9X4QUM1_9BACL|nr:DUF3889 domain-containing protein [Cohnella rhizosphaerae]MDG0811649.1 YqzG/YhdC family protein [Cohnella rhizosphaerae]
MSRHYSKSATGKVRPGFLVACIALLAAAVWIGLAVRAGRADAADTTYHKWSLIAIEETKHKYPKAALVDYSHIGRTQLEGGLSEEKFKLWLRQADREFGVYVTVRFSDAEDRLVSVDMRETPR